MLSRTAFRTAYQLSSRQPALALARTSAITIQSRSTATSPPPQSAHAAATQDEAYSILVEQRKRRPTSPHLRIYQPQLTWYLSSLNRITGVIVSGGVYAFGAAYAIAPLAGWHLESGTLAAGFAALPMVVQLLIKGTVALPFTFHAWNGVRHLVWDTGKALDIKNVYRTGYTVIGLTAVSTLALMFI